MDLINRQDAIDAISTWDKFGVDNRSQVVRWYEGLEPYVKLRDVVWAIENLPSAQPERKKGWWIAQNIHNCHTDFECSECGYIHNFIHLYGKPTADYTYCPNCGSDMKGEDDE